MNSKIIGIVALLTLVGCGKEPLPKDIFRYNDDAGITSLDPAFAKDQSNIWAVTQIFNGLVETDSNLNIKPALAHAWSITDSGKTYIFHLRKDVFFHHNACFQGNGTRLFKSSDVAYSYTRLLDPVTASPGSWIFNDKLSTTQAPFETPNDSTFILHLSKPFPPMLGLLAMPYCFIVPKEAIAKYGKDVRSNPVGTGPFQLKIWKEGVVLAMEKNIRYFEYDSEGNHLPYLNGIQVGFIQGKQGAFLEFLQGRLDFFNGLESSFKDELLGTDGKLKAKYINSFQMQVGPYLNTEYLGFQTSEQCAGAITDKRIRRAISMAIDRKALVKFLRNNIGIPAFGGFIPMGLPGHFECINPYNPNEAKKLLAEAGYSEQKPFEIKFATTPNYTDLAIFIQKELEDIGVKTEIQVNPGSTQRQMISEGRLSFFRASWIADYPDAENYLSLFYSGNQAPNGPNYTRFNNHRFDSLYSLALNEVNDSIRWHEYQEMDELILDESPVVVLFYDQSIRLIAPEVEGLYSNPLNIPIIKWVKK